MIAGNSTTSTSVTSRLRPPPAPPAVAPATLAFELAFGAKPVVAIQYLYGYDEALGTAEVGFSAIRPPGGHRDGAVELCAQTMQANACRLERLRATSAAHHLRRRVSLAARRRDGHDVTQTSTLSMEVWRQASDHAHEGGVRPAGDDDQYVGMSGFGVAPYSNATLTITLACAFCKFKVIGVFAC